MFVAIYKVESSLEDVISCLRSLSPDMDPFLYKSVFLSRPAGTGGVILFRKCLRSKFNVRYSGKTCDEPNELSRKMNMQFVGTLAPPAVSLFQ